MAQSSESESEIYLEDAEYDFDNLDVTIAVTEAEGEDIEEEFNDALSEIHGEKSFPCAKCEKVCKSKGGLTRHTNAKHNEITAEQASIELDLFCPDTVASIVESIKAQIFREKLYGSDMNDSIKAASSSQALFNALFPLYAKFCRKKSQDQLVESFFALMPQSTRLLNCEDYKAANLIMIHIPDHLVGFYNINRGRTDRIEAAQTSEASQPNTQSVDKAERGPLSYVAGYVVSKLFQTSKRKNGEHKEELNSLLQSMKSSGTSSFIASRTRGGLVNPSENLVGILEEAEKTFRQQVCESKLTLRNIPVETICNLALKSPKVKSLWENIVLTAGVNTTGQTQKLCLENLIKLYLKVRSFSYARDYLNKHKIKEKKTRQKALRKDLKRSADSPT